MVETKFNAWHDPTNGQFTFSGQGITSRDTLGPPRARHVVVRSNRAAQPPRASDLVQRFKQHMIPTENDRNDVYLDSEGIPTVGIGHKVTPNDGLEVGDRISDARKDDFWKKDSAKALTAAVQQMREAGIKDPTFVLPLADANFQLGRGWTTDFKRTWALIKAGNYEAAAQEVKNSKWYKQTPHRVESFQRAVLGLSPKPIRKKKP